MFSFLIIREILTAFMVLFAVIDITGSIPIIIDLNSTGKKVEAGKAALISLGLMTFHRAIPRFLSPKDF